MSATIVEPIRWVPRTIKIPLVFLDDEQWRDLRRIAYQCSQYGNKLLSESYAKAKGHGEFTTYTDASDDLSAAIRDAVGREVVGLWRRLGKKILRGEQTLARFSADRALVVRDRGVTLKHLGGDDYRITLRLDPKSKGPVHEFTVWPNALKRDWYLQKILDRLASGDWKITKATLQFERPGRKVFIRLAFDKRIDPADPEELTRTAGMFMDHEGLLYLTCDGRALTLGDQTHRLRQMKEHFAGIHSRLRSCLGKRGRRRDLRKALLKAGSFEKWSEGPLHQMSAQIADWCWKQRVAVLEWRIKSDLSLPLDRLRQLVAYKCGEFGMQVSQLDAESEQE